MEEVSIKAYIRIRPGNGGLRHDARTVYVDRDCGDAMGYEFDGVFGPGCTQRQVFDALKSVVPMLLNGTNQTLFCYGNTGAGKTHTMVGTRESPGLMRSLVEEILRRGECVMSYMEIYNEKIYDLLEPRELLLREVNRMVVVPGLAGRRVRCMRDFEEMFLVGMGNRTTAETKLNKNSSRSHAILRIGVGDSKLHLIDLAGSENNRRTGNEGIRLAESSNINRSLFVLGKVVNAIVKKEARVPYRDSKLTRLLQDSLGGSSLCYIVANVADDMNELGNTVSTLGFASKSRKIVNVKMDRRPLAVKTNARFNVSRRERKPGNNSSLLKSLLDRPDVVLSPGTKEKSYRAFLRRAQELEAAQKYRLALEDYRTVQKFCDNDFVRQKIDALGTQLKTSRKKMHLGPDEVLRILNNGKFFDIKQLPNVGDKRAQAIVDFVGDGNLFESLSDLKLLFSERVVQSILVSSDNAS